MMHRMQRKYGFRRFPPFPRKGRIRLVLMALLTLGFVRYSPSLIKGIQVFTPVNAREAPAEENPAGDSVAQKLTYARIAGIVSGNPSCHGTNRVYVSTGEDSLLINTSIDTSLQRYASKLMAQYHPRYGALAALDPVTGRVLSLVSYVHDSMPDPGGNLCFRSLFPAASVYKTITAAAAIELCGYDSRCVVEHRGRSHTLYRAQIAPVLDWYVDLPFALAYARSINAVFARIGMYDLGASSLLSFSSRFGFNVPIPGELICDISTAMMPDSLFALAELASGFNQHTTISPLHGALLAATVVENGTMPVPTLVDSVIDLRTGAGIFTRKNRAWDHPIGERTARELQVMMHAVVNGGTAHRQFRTLRNSRWFDPFLSGGKTGSVDKDGYGRIDWFVGYAAHPQDIDERIALGVVTVHGEYWTVHSSYLAAEVIGRYLRSIRKTKSADEKDSLTANVTQAGS